MKSLGGEGGSVVSINRKGGWYNSPKKKEKESTILFSNCTINLAS